MPFVLCKFKPNYLCSMTKSTAGRTLVTAALPYANGPIHIGHLAGCLLPADIYARHLRSKGEDILFVSGTDEHGVAITMKARKDGKTPQEVVDEYSDLISSSLKNFGLEFDVFSRTSKPIHHETASELFLKLYEKGGFDEETREQYYDTEAEQFLADRYIMGECPRCDNPDAYGDQCEKCGATLSPMELKNPRSAISGSKPVLKESKNWYLPLDRLQKSFIDEYIEEHKHWKSHVYGQCKSWLNEGLKPRAMTRDLDWGVPVPLEGADGKVMYVWFDAPIGYISATRELTDEWELWWKDQNTRLVHFIGKDNIVFHCIIFPAILHELGEFIVPEDVPANEFLNLEGQKISTSRNHAIWLHEYLEELPDRTDELRYVLTAISPETKDSDFTWKDYQARVNNELVAILGNFVNRVMVLTHKYFNGLVPELQNTEEAKNILEEAEQHARRMDECIVAYQFREGQAELLNIARLGNRYITEKEPWKMIKTDETAVADTLRVCLEICRKFALEAEAFLPKTSKKMLQMMQLADGRELESGHPIGSTELLFSKIEDDVIDVQLKKLEKAQSKHLEVPAAKAETSFDDFMKMDLRVATILEAQKVPKADKLLQFRLNTGLDERTVVSGIAEHFSPEELIGKKVMVLANLAARKIRGVESQGMILLSENADGRLMFVEPHPDAENGSVIR